MLFRSCLQPWNAISEGGAGSLGILMMCFSWGKPTEVNLFLCLLCRSRKDSLESDSSTAIIPHELIRTRQLESVHLKFNQESGALIPLCLR